jgi:hypothetical protein
VENRPDIPALDTVERQSASNTGLGCFALVLLFIYITVLKDYVSPIVAVPAIALLLVTGFIRGYMSGCTLRTSGSGLLIEQPFRRKKFLRWSEIEDIDVKHKEKEPARVTLVGGDFSFTLPDWVWSDPLLQASFWQHLKRYGLAEIFPISEDAKSLWYRISDDVPEVQQWKVSDDLLTRKLGLRSFEILEDRIAVETRDYSHSLEWRAVNEAGWERQDDHAWAVRICAIDHPDSVRFVLAVIRKLRKIQKPQLLAIVGELRDSPWVKAG